MATKNPHSNQSDANSRKEKSPPRKQDGFWEMSAQEALRVDIVTTPKRSSGRA